MSLTGNTPCEGARRSAAQCYAVLCRRRRGDAGACIGTEVAIDHSGGRLTGHCAGRRKLTRLLVMRPRSGVGDNSIVVGLPVASRTLDVRRLEFEDVGEAVSDVAANLDELDVAAVDARVADRFDADSMPLG